MSFVNLVLNYKTHSLDYIMQNPDFNFVKCLLIIGGNVERILHIERW